ncbi:amylase [Peptidiphaga gingivicola]|uniref:Amylase n=1 Tax=Peptidiphaga gingivicola TaxID=2741497 RepID=A0A179B1K2_9ACTO|nr:glycoside hydrolase family 13 protein [Peptidiphaga gingivicola]OAP85572.1 amylase [Peptidiphaga gingivicola]
MLLHTPTAPGLWWRDAVIYQIYPRSFASSGGPIGDIPGAISRLDHLARLGVDAVWLSPFYRSPQRDAGYDVEDYRDIDPVFGTMDDVDALIARAHSLGLRIIFDIVPNHTSDRHVWFRQALEAGPGSPERERYWFRPAPNNWRSVFGGGAWTRVCDREDAPGSPWESDASWYLHLFDSSQPDLNWSNPEVQAEFRDILRFWLRRGVDGFRVDVAHGLVKDPALPNWGRTAAIVEGEKTKERNEAAPMWNLDGVHDIYRQWRKVLDEFGPDRMLVAEAWVSPASAIAKYVRADEMSQSFNFEFLASAWTADRMRTVIADSLRNMDAVGATATWVLSNHDVIRATARLGLPDAGNYPKGIKEGDPLPDEVGHRRALAAHALMSALPGSAYIWQGEELNLPEHMALPDELREDPAYFRTKGEETGRDGCRVPLPWEADSPAFGFSPDGKSWLPQPPEWKEYAVDRESADPRSPLNLFRRMYALRRELRLGCGGLVDVTDDLAADSRGLAFLNTPAASLNTPAPTEGGDAAHKEPRNDRRERGLEGHAGLEGGVDLEGHAGLEEGRNRVSGGVDEASREPRSEVLVITAFDEPVRIPEGWRPILCSTDEALDGSVPADATAWFERA